MGRNISWHELFAGGVLSTMPSCCPQAELSNLEAELEACIAGDDDAPAETAQHERTPGQPDAAADWLAARHHLLTPAPNRAAAGVSSQGKGNS